MRTRLPPDECRPRCTVGRAPSKVHADRVASLLAKLDSSWMTATVAPAKPSKSITKTTLRSRLDRRLQQAEPCGRSRLRGIERGRITGLDRSAPRPPRPRGRSPARAAARHPMGESAARSAGPSISLGSRKSRTYPTETPTFTIGPGAVGGAMFAPVAKTKRDALKPTISLLERRSSTIRWPASAAPTRNVAWIRSCMNARTCGLAQRPAQRSRSGRQTPRHPSRSSARRDERLDRLRQPRCNTLRALALRLLVGRHAGHLRNLTGENHDSPAPNAPLVVGLGACSCSVSSYEG